MLKQHSFTVNFFSQDSVSVNGNEECESHHNIRNLPPILHHERSNALIKSQKYDHFPQYLGRGGSFFDEFYVSYSDSK